MRQFFPGRQSLCPECLISLYIAKARDRYSITHPVSDASGILTCSRGGESLILPDEPIYSKESGKAYLQLFSILCKGCQDVLYFHNILEDRLRVKFTHPDSNCPREIILPLALFTFFL